MIKNNLKKIIFVFIGILVMVLVLIGPIIWENEFNKNLKVIFLNVGQGDSILIKTPNKQNILIDGGPDNKVLYGLGKNIPFYRRQIDLIILTHSDFDHITGLIEVLKRYKVKKVFYNGLYDNSLEFQEWIKTIKEKNIPLETVAAGKEINLGNDLMLKDIFPFESSIVGSNNNNTSLVNKLIYKKVSFLFTGDLEQEGEDELINRKEDLKSDVLKIGHHGSKNSTSQNFLEKVLPRYAIISVGKNRFGHPSLRILSRLKRLGINILRTDINGEIRIESDGNGLWIKTGLTL